MNLLTLLQRAALAATLASSLPTLARAALPIELEVAAEGEAPMGAMQEWNKVLMQMDLARVQLRGARTGDKPTLEVVGEGKSQRFRLLGLLNRQDQLVLPGGKFKQGDRDKLKQFLNDLPKRAEGGDAKTRPFGLKPEQMALVIAELSKPFNEPTQGAAPHELLTALTKDVRFPVEGDIAMKAKLRDAPPFRAQMKGLSTGTVLAAMLRGAGLQFAPDTLGKEPITLRVVPLDPKTPSWPVGWAPTGGPRELAPAMYEVRNVEIGNFTLAAALDALQSTMGVPLVLDQYVLAAHDINPAEIQVTVPKTKTYIRRAVDTLLAQGRLSGELRVDEAGTPFYWITQYGKDSAKATPMAPPGH